MSNYKKKFIPYGKHYVDQDDIDAVVDCLQSGVLTQGNYINKFEKTVAEYVGVKYAVAVSSCTAGLHLACLAAGVNKKNAVLTSAISFVASASAASMANANVNFVDIETETINMCSKSLEMIIKKTPNVKAVIPVHFAGLPCDTELISSIAEKHNAVVIEDGAHALGSEYADGSKVGSCSNSLMTVFSFHPVKMIAAGEGGMITTNDFKVYRKLLRLRSHGITKFDDVFFNKKESKTNSLPNNWYYEMQELGFHYRITDIQSSLGSSQLKKIRKFLLKRQKLADKYYDVLSEFPFCRPAQNCINFSKSAHHIFPVRINFKEAKISRAQLMKNLLDLGIGTQVHYIPIPMQPYFSNQGHKITDYPNAMKYYQEALTIPLYYSLSEKEQSYVLSNLKEQLTCN